MTCQSSWAGSFRRWWWSSPCHGPDAAPRCLLWSPLQSSTAWPSPYSRTPPDKSPVFHLFGTKEATLRETFWEAPERNCGVTGSFILFYSIVKTRSFFLKMCLARIIKYKGAHLVLRIHRLARHGAKTCSNARRSVWGWRQSDKGPVRHFWSGSVPSGAAGISHSQTQTAGQKNKRKVKSRRGEHCGSHSVGVRVKRPHLSSAQRHRWKEIILHPVHGTNYILKHPFVALRIDHLDLFGNHKLPINKCFSIIKQESEEI